MPYEIRKKGNKWCLYNAQTGRRFGCHDSEADAQKQMGIVKSKLQENSARYLVLRGAVGEIRTATFEDRDHVVMPVVALVEGVIWPSNAPAPELVLAEKFSVAPQGWNGRAVFCSHPKIEGQSVSGNSPEVLASSVGLVFNTQANDKRLKMEAWVDKSRAEKCDPGKKLLTRIEALQNGGGKPIEVSVGAYVTVREESGEFGGKKYEAVWDTIVPDHLALLSEEEVGACSVEAGCGTPRAATLHTLSANGLEFEDNGDSVDDDETDLLSLRNIPQSERDKIPAEDFAGPERSFPIVTPEDVSAAAHSLGRTKHDRTAVRKKIIAIAYRKGPRYVAKLPETWKKKKDQKGRSLLGRLFDSLRQSMSSEDMSDMDVRRALQTALNDQKSDTSQCMVEAVYNDHVVYSEWDPENGGPYYYSVPYELNADGSIKLGSNAVEVQPVLSYDPLETATERTTDDKKKFQSMHDYSVELGATCPLKAASEHRCSCQEGDKMKTREERIAALVANSRSGFTEADKTMLAAASDERLAAFEAEVTKTDEKAIERKQRVDKLLADAKSGFTEADRKMLEVASDERLTAFETAASKTEEPKKEEPKKEEPAVEEPKPQTTAEWLKTAPPEVRAMVERQQAQDEARRAELVGALKTAQKEYTEDELKKMELGELERLNRAFGSVAPRVADFSALSPRKPDDSKTPPPPIDLNARIRDARAKQASA